VLSSTFAWSRIAARRRLGKKHHAISASLVTVRCFSALAQLLPTSSAIRMGAFIGRVAHNLAPWRCTVLRENLRYTRAFRQRSDSDDAAGEAELERRAYEHLGRALMLTLQYPAKVEASLALRTEDDHVAALRADCLHGGVVVTSAHHGLWELLPSVVSSLVPPPARAHARIVYRPLHDRALDAWLRHRREVSAHVELVPDRGSLGKLKQCLARGGVVGLVCDQRPGASVKGPRREGGRRSARRGAHPDDDDDEKGGHNMGDKDDDDDDELQPRAPLTVELLGQTCALSPGLCALHASTGAPVWFVALSLVGHERAMRLQLVRLAERGENMPSSTLAARYARAVSAAVVEAPEQYFWWHRRW
jgi:lauroyl/myristoyl acyltransferase